MTRMTQEVRIIALGLAAAFLLALGSSAHAQEAPAAPATEVVDHSTVRSADGATLVLELASGDDLVITLSDGHILINSIAVGRYEKGGAFETAWRETLAELEGEGTGEMLAGVQHLEVNRLQQYELEGIAAYAEALAELRPAGEAAAEEVTLDNLDATIAAAVSAAEAAAAAATAEAIRSSGGVTVVTAPDAAPRGVGVSPVQVGVGGASLVGGIASGLLSLLATFVGLAFMGLGFIFFAPRQLETVADTAWHSFWRSFLAGLFAQPLIVPAFGVMVVGLALTVIGVVVIPFAAVAFAAALVLAVIGGYVAMARTIGEIYLRRKMARGEAIRTWGTFRYIVYGLAGLLAIWAPAIVLGRVPIAGDIATVVAALTTYVIGTAGFGATIISRAGVRGTFVRRLDMALTDEQFWTPEALTASGSRGRVSQGR